MTMVQHKDTLNCVHIDYAAENAFLKDGEYYENDPDRPASGAHTTGSTSVPRSDFERGRAIAKSITDGGARITHSDFKRGREIARSIRR